MRALVTDLGFHSAEMRTLAGRLAEACAREELDYACDLAGALQEYSRDYTKLYVRFLALRGHAAVIAAGARTESTSL